MDSCPSDLSGQEASLLVSSGPTFMGLVLDFSEGLARLAGFGLHGAGPASLSQGLGGEAVLSVP